MIYLDSAATSLLKPVCVQEAVLRALRRCASPGRGSHAAAMEAADILLACREEAARLFHVPDPAQIVFTMNATHALNIAIFSLVRPGDRVVVSGYEHNAVLRPLYAAGAEIDAAAAPLFRPEETLAAFRARLDGAQAAVCTHVSNVFGYILPIGEIAALCRDAGVPLIVDASQSAGVLPLDFSALGCAFAAMPGHKGLLGPQGTGLLLCAGAETRPRLFGGTGSLSASREMPDFLPDRLEAGTHNVPGVAGLLEGLRYVSAVGTAQIDREERAMLRALAALLDGAALRLFLSPRPELQTGVLSAVPLHIDAEAAAEALGERGVAVRAGLHCAPLAHESAGTRETGTLRLSFSPLLRRGELAQAAKEIKIITDSGYKM